MFHLCRHSSDKSNPISYKDRGSWSLERRTTRVSGEHGKESGSRRRVTGQEIVVFNQNGDNFETHLP